MKLDFNNIGALRIGGKLFARRKFYVGSYNACVCAGGSQLPIIQVDSPNNGRPVLNIDGRVWLRLNCISGTHLVQGGYLGPVVARWRRIARNTTEYLGNQGSSWTRYSCRHVYEDGDVFEYSRYFEHEETNLQFEQTFLGVIPAVYSGGAKVEPLDGPSASLDDWGGSKRNKGNPFVINGLIQPVTNQYYHYELETVSTASSNYEDYYPDAPPASWLTNYVLEEFKAEGLVFGDLFPSNSITSRVNPSDVPDVPDG